MRAVAALLLKLNPRIGKLQELRVLASEQWAQAVAAAGVAAVAAALRDEFQRMAG